MTCVVNSCQRMVVRVLFLQSNNSLVALEMIILMVWELYPILLR